MDPVILARVQDRLFALRIRAEAEQSERQAEIYKKLPRVKEIDGTLGSAAARIVRDALADGGDPIPKLDELRSRSGELQMERDELLRSAGYSPDALEVHYQCKKCGDTGRLPDGSVCSCLLQMYSDEQLGELEQYLPVRKAGFDKFDETLYSNAPYENRSETPRENACAVRDFCRELAVSKKPERSLFIYGGAGTGKTFLAAATAVEASRLGKSVCCRSMSELVSLYEREKFTRDDDTRDAAESEIARLENCDLLIIDDFGSEFRAPFAESALIGLLTSRLRRELPMLICSGLTTRGEVDGRYSPQVTSRLLGDEFFALPLYGSDLRRAGR